MSEVEEVSSMRLEAMLADSAVVSESKLFVQGGGWNLLNPVALPAPVPRIALALVVHVPYAATNIAHSLQVRLENEDADLVPLGYTMGPDGPAPVMRAGGDFGLGRPPELLDGDEQILPMALNFDGVIFHEPGMYAFVIEIDGHELSRQRFRVQPPTGAGGQHATE